jgi:hypothetical protein
MSYAPYDTPSYRRASAEREADEREQAAAAKAPQEQRDAEQPAQAVAQLETEKSRARASWFAHGGDAESFEREWPQLGSNIIHRRVAAEQTECERVSVQMFRGLWSG